MKNLKILHKLKEKLDSFYPNLIDKVILFGSQINNTFDEFSDYDILIILKEAYDWKLEKNIIDLCYDIDLEFEIVTDIKIISKKELNEPRGKQTFIQEAINYGISA